MRLRVYFYRQGPHVLPLMIILLLISILLFPQPLTSTAAPTTDFDATQALAYATHLASTIGERPAGSTGEHEAAAWLTTQFTNLGYAVTVEPFVYARQGVQTVGMNIVAVKAGQPDYGTIYVGAHYDTPVYPFAGPGANDNASGVGVLLEVAHLLASQPLTPTLILIAFSAEEDHLVGSDYYALHLTPVERMRAMGMLNLDCVGIGEALYLNVINPDHLAFAENLGVIADAIRYEPRANSDHAPFAAIGMPAVYFDMHTEGSHACGPDYHTSRDTADKLALPTLQWTGNALVTALATLAHAAQPRPVWQLYLPLLRTAPSQRP